MNALAICGGSPVRTRSYPPWPDYSEAEEQVLLDVLHSRAWGGYHPQIAALERNFAAYHGVAHGISCANGTVALEVALRALGIRPGDEVIVPAYTFIATASSVLLCQAIPIFADIDPHTCNLSPAAVEAAITPRTRAITVVHFGGHPADMETFQDIAQRHGLALIEDAAHAHGARFAGRAVGGWGDAATFSFQSFKLMTAGEGGIILTNSATIAENCWSYCNQGRRHGGGWFEHARLGTNYRLTGFQAGVLNAQLGRLATQSERRAANLEVFREGLRNIAGLTLVADDPRVEQHPHYLVTLRFHTEAFASVSRDLVLQAMQAEGAPVKPTYPCPLYRNSVFLDYCEAMKQAKNWRATQDYSRLKLPECERACRDGIWISHNAFLGDRQDVVDLLAALEKVQRLAPDLAAVAAAGEARESG